MNRKRARPSDPLAIARRRAAEREALRDPANWGLDRNALALAVNAEVEIRAGADPREARARRVDVFDRLLAGEALTAVRRLQRDMVTMHARAGGVACYAEHIDASRTADDGMDLRHRAARRVDAVLAHTGAASGRLIMALLEPGAALGKPTEWRAVVERESGERLADAQCAVLRAACRNLAEAYSRLGAMHG